MSISSRIAKPEMIECKNATSNDVISDSNLPEPQSQETSNERQSDENFKKINVSIKVC